MFTRGRSGGPRSATTELAGDPIRSPVERRSPGRAVAEHFDAVSGVYYEMVDAYRTDLGYYHARELEEAERWARALQPARILDAGSGPGRHTRRVLILGLETVSVDVSRNMLRELVGERAGSDAPATARPVQGDIRSLPFRSTAFDFIVCMEVIEHLPSFPGDVQRAALELTRSLRPGGHLILEFPLRLARAR